MEIGGGTYGHSDQGVVLHGERGAGQAHRPRIVADRQKIKRLILTYEPNSDDARYLSVL